MSYIDCITIAAQRAQDWNLPVSVWPTFIENEANLLSGHEAGHRAEAGWAE